MYEVIVSLIVLGFISCFNFWYKQKAKKEDDYGRN